MLDSMMLRAARTPRATPAADEPIVVRLATTGPLFLIPPPPAGFFATP